MSTIEEYPIDYYEFQRNQVLRAEELNQTRESVAQEVCSTRSALIGMGIICGLNGVTNGARSVLTLKPGYGVTPSGWLIRRTSEINFHLLASQIGTGTPTPITIESLEDSTLSFNDSAVFESTNDGGFSLVLEIEVPEVTVGGACNPENCNQSSFLVQPLMKLTKKAGFRRIPLYQIANIPRAVSRVLGDGTWNFTELKNILKTGLAGKIDDDLWDPFELTAPGFLFGNTYLVHRLNEVRDEYYQYLLCKAKTAACAGLTDPFDARNGLVLGYFQKISGTTNFEWKSDYRDVFVRAFDPYDGLTCEIYVERIRELLSRDFTIPSVNTNPPELVSTDTVIWFPDDPIHDFEVGNVDIIVRIPPPEEAYKDKLPFKPLGVDRIRFDGIAQSPATFEHSGVALRGHVGCEVSGVVSVLAQRFSENKIPIDITTVTLQQLSQEEIWQTSTPMGGGYFGGTIALVTDGNPNGLGEKVIGDVFLPSRGNAVTKSVHDQLSTRVGGLESQLGLTQGGQSLQRLDLIESQISDTALTMKLQPMVADSVEDTFSTHPVAYQVSCLQTQISSMSGYYSDFHSSLSDFGSTKTTVAQLETRVSALEAAVGQIQTAIAAIQSSVSKNTLDIYNHQQEYQALKARVEVLEKQ